ITHAIKRYVKFGHDIDSGEDIERAIKDIAGTHIAHLEPNRNQHTKVLSLILVSLNDDLVDEDENNEPETIDLTDTAEIDVCNEPEGS
ncbi:9464_t:CDS:2, partial [Dentiscutata heterogama]